MRSELRVSRPGEWRALDPLFSSLAHRTAIGGDIAESARPIKRCVEGLWFGPLINLARLCAYVFSSQADACGDGVLVHVGIEDSGLLLARRSASSEGFDGVGVVPMFKDVDAGGVYRVGGEVKVDTAGSVACGGDDSDGIGQERRSLARSDGEMSGYDDHRRIADADLPASNSDRPQYAAVVAARSMSFIPEW